MPQTTTAKNACNVKVHMDNDSGVLVDISGSANRAEIAFTNQIGEYQVFGGDWIKRLTCKKDARMTLGIVFTTAAAEGWKLLKSWLSNYNATPRTVRVMAPDDSIGSDDFTGEWLIESFNVPFDGTQATPVMISLNLVQTDGITFGTVAT